MRWGLLLGWLLWASVVSAADVDEPPATISTDTYLWEKSVAFKLHVLTTTNRLPVGGRLSGKPGQLLVAKTSTNKGFLYVNISAGPGEGDSWGEVALK